MLRFGRFAAFALAAALLTLPRPAAAWGARAHRVVADLAARQLRPQARAEVARLLAGEADPTLVGVSNWADELREHDAERGPATMRWHFMNFPHGSCEYVPPRDCPDGRCLIAAINRQFLALADTTRPAGERAEALKFLVHLVADVHQPLHTGYADDKGGNLYQLSYAGEGTNLHAAWDVRLPKRRDLDPTAYADFLAAQPPLPDDPTRRSDRPAVDWALESCALVHAPGFYPGGHELTDAYLDTQLPVAELRLRLAGQRLADMLNFALARPATAQATP